MTSLLMGLLEYSRVTTKSDPFAKANLTVIVSEVLSDLEVKIETTGAQVQLEELPVVKADPTQMRQLFQNLIGNALKFHKTGEKPAVKISSSSIDDCKLQIVVEDKGIGFDEKYLDKIFAPFQRLHGKSSQFKGSGVGLAICKKIVERHGGSITATSTPGVGSSFIIRLPLDTDLTQ
jgi:signal transduction histidine kinase